MSNKQEVVKESFRIIMKKGGRANTSTTTILKVLVSFCCLILQQNVSAFSLPDTFHIVETTATHVAPHVKNQMMVHHNNPNILESYKQLLSSHPLPTKMMTGATLAVCGDAIAQSKDVDKDYDKRRAVSFAAFDMVYRAVQHYSFPIIVAACHGQYLGSLLPTNADLFDASQLGAMEQTLASQLGIVPFFYYPVFFSLTGFMQGLSVSGTISRAKENFLPLMKRNLLFWIPVQFVQFGYIQEDLQIPFLSMCGLAWTFILSVAAGSAKSYTPEKEMEKEIIAAAVETERDTASKVPSPASTIIAQRS